MNIVVVAAKDVHDRVATAIDTESAVTWAGKELPPTLDAGPDVLVFAPARLDQLALHSSLETARAVAESARLVLIAPDRSVPARRMLDLGADGVVWNSQIESTLAVTVAAVMAGQLVVPSDSRGSAYRPALSAREKQVLALVVLGLTNAEIAEKLFLTESTIKSHLATSFRKLGVQSRNDAVARILDPTDGLGTGILSITDVERDGELP